MPVGYGSNFPLPQLSLAELGTTPEAGLNLGWLSILLNVIEIGASMFLGPAVGTAIAAVNAGAQTGIEYAETGQVSGVSAGLNFGSSIIPGLTSGVKALRTGTKISESAQPLLKQLGEDTAKDIKSLSENLVRRSGRSPYSPTAQNPNLGQRTMDYLAGNSYAKVNGYKIERLGPGGAETIRKNIQAASKWTSNRIDKLMDLQEKINTLQSQSRISAREYKEFMNLPGQAGKGGTAGRLARRYRPLNVTSTVTGEAASDTGADVESKVFRKVADDTGLFISEIKRLRGLVREGKIINARLYRQILEKAYARTGNALLEAAILGTKQAKFLKLLTSTETTAMKVSRISSKTMAWAQKIGGYLMSPSTLAADTISKTVAKLTTKVEEIGEELATKLNKWFKMGAKGLQNIEDEFEKTGGILFKSKWILGYKVLMEDEISSSILIQFKNEHPNVVVKVTPTDLKAWAEADSRGRWYINNLARGRGGRTLSELGIEGKLENLLGMLPIAKINEIVGFAGFSEGFISQIRAGSGTMIWQTGDYIEGFKEGLIQGVIAEGIKASVALGTRNQYAKQVLEGGFGAVSSGTTFGTAFSTSFASGAQSMKDTIFEDTTKAGSIVKNVKVVQGSGSAIKGVF